MINENDICESYNKMNNDFLTNRKVTNFISCPKCNGAGSFYSAVCDPAVWKCNNCNGEKYVHNPT